MAATKQHDKERDYITASEAAKILNAPYRVVLGLLSCGGGVWVG